MSLEKNFRTSFGRCTGNYDAQLHLHLRWIRFLTSIMMVLISAFIREKSTLSYFGRAG